MYSFDSRVRYSECDEDARLSLVSLVNYLQDCSTFQSEHLGIGLEFMHEHHFAWFIAAWRIDIKRLPRFGENVRVGTWCYDLGSTSARRNFVILDERGDACVKADSLWFTFDFDRGRPVRIPASERAYLCDDPQLEMTPLERKIAVAGPYREAHPITVVEQHLDTNRHVNNAQYVLMALDALGARLELTGIGVQYARMAMLGDVLLPRVHESDTGWVVELVREDGVVCAVVRLDGKTSA